mmetsp:Transcript_1674/g.1607  ORF Transcript_1674/g.1607 Transcript_1674/m.1607 type:complete len:94 (+) Transcript_1674:459-740(+)
MRNLYIGNIDEYGALFNKDSQNISDQEASRKNCLKFHMSDVQGYIHSNLQLLEGMVKTVTDFEERLVKRSKGFLEKSSTWKAKHSPNPLQTSP